MPGNAGPEQPGLGQLPDQFGGQRAPSFRVRGDRPGQVSGLDGRLPQGIVRRETGHEGLLTRLPPIA